MAMAKSIPSQVFRKDPKLIIAALKRILLLQKPCLQEKILKAGFIDLSKIDAWIFVKRTL
jgi:hypothetical protein